MATGLTNRSIAAPAILVFGLFCSATGHAQISTDGTVGPRVELGGPEIGIGAELGRQAGRNLFHSFERFSLATGERATFSGPDQIRNVISRVTGGERSDIDGTLRSTIPGADFYFINPAGVLFGPNASLDLQGSFHVSTADQLRFADGQVFSADLDARSSFTVAAPEAFGFLGPTPAPILVDRSTLQVPPGEALSLVGGDITVDGGGTQRLLLVAEAGLITLAAVGGPGEAELVSGAVTANQAADIRLADGAEIATRGDGGGTIRIRGGNFVAENESIIFAVNAGAVDARGGIVVDAEAVTIGSGSALIAAALGAGAAGAVRVTAGEVEVRDGSLIASDTHAVGAAGGVTINAGRLLVSGTGAAGSFTGVSSSAESGSTGAGGMVTVNAREVEVRDGGVIIGSTLGTGDAGTVRVTAGEVEVHNSSAISSRTMATGAAGVLTIRAGRLSIRDGGVVETISFGSGAPGTIELRVGRLHVRDGGFVSASAASQDTPAGDMLVGGIDIVADIEIVITGQRLDAASGKMVPSNINTQTFGARPADSIMIRTPDLRILEHGAIDSSTRGDASAGAIQILVDRLVMGPRAFINSSNVAGSLEIGRPDALGSAGTIEISATESIDMAGSPAVGQLAAIGTITTAAGSGGTVTIVTGRLRMVRGGISTESTGTGNAGNISITARDELVLDRSDIFTTARDAGGGQITLQVGDLIDLQNSSIASSVAEAAGNAGDITIDSSFLVLDDSQILARAVAGRGGDIRIVADHLVLSPDSLINAEAGEEGVDGTVVTSEPAVDLGALVVLDVALLDADALLRQRCAARQDVGASSFTGVGRGGLPASPDRPLGSTYRSPAEEQAADKAARPAALVISCSGGL
jgi:filamentous hemagglutinin family protein